MGKALTEEERKQVREATAREEIEFALFTLQLFRDIVLKNQGYIDLILSDAFTLPTYYMGMVDANNKVNFYDGKIRVVDPDGKEFVKYAPKDYLDVIAERVEPWTYLKFPYLKKVGWKGLVAGKDSGVYQATPLSRLNAADGMATPRAQEAYEEMYKTLGQKAGSSHLWRPTGRGWSSCSTRPSGCWSWPRIPEITNPHVRNIPTEKPTEGVGTVEAPRGTLTHHYVTDEKGIVTKANLVVGTTNNYAPISISVRRRPRR